jgi:thiol-disulfide isomerase/thioredoxin
MHAFRCAITPFLLLLAAAATGVSGADPALKPRTSHRTPSPLVLPDLAGKRHSLEDYRGKVVLVNFFGTWCAPCLEEMPSLQVLAAALEDHPFTVLAVDVGDSPARLRQVFGEQKESFIILIDSEQTAARSWGSLAFPTSFVLDPAVAAQVIALLPKASSPATDSDAGSNKESQPAVPHSD